MFFIGLIIGCIIMLLVMNQKNQKLKTEKEALAKELHFLSTKDSLSGLYNNRYIYDYLDTRLKHIGDQALSVLLMDIDHFKVINDKFGHRYGDDVLRLIALELEACTNEDDVLGRYGGEEFIIVLNPGDLTRSLEVAEKIRANIESMQLKGNEKLTISIGIAFYNNDTASTLINKADVQLLQAKKLGRNRVKGE